MPEYFSAYVVNENEKRLDLAFTVMAHDCPARVLQKISLAMPELRWTQGYSGRAPAGEYAFLPSAVP